MWKIQTVINKLNIHIYFSIKFIVFLEDGFYFSPACSDTVTSVKVFSLSVKGIAVNKLPCYKTGWPSPVVSSHAEGNYRAP